MAPGLLAIIRKHLSAQIYQMAKSEAFAFQSLALIEEIGLD